MPLLASDQVEKLLRCPRCLGELAREDGSWRCASATCPAAAGAFPVVGGQPVLVDFEHSVLDREEQVRAGAASLVPRAPRLGRWEWARRLFRPDNRVARAHAADLVERLRARLRARLLVVGGGTVGSGAEALYETGGIELVGFDIYASPVTQFIADAHHMPLADASVDAVWVQAVLEHVLDPWQVVAGIERVLAPDGLVYAETPFLQHVHEGPYDFTRFTESGHRWLFRRFERLDSGVVAGPGNQFAWSADHLVRGLTRSAMAGKAARMAVSWLQAFDRLVPERFAVDAASCVYFYGRRTGRELTPREIIAHYRGAQGRRA